MFGTGINRRRLAFFHLIHSGNMGTRKSSSSPKFGLQNRLPSSAPKSLVSSGRVRHESESCTASALVILCGEHYIDPSCCNMCIHRTAHHFLHHTLSNPLRIENWESSTSINNSKFYSLQCPSPRCTPRINSRYKGVSMKQSTCSSSINLKQYSKVRSGYTRIAPFHDKCSCLSAHEITPQTNLFVPSAPV